MWNILIATKTASITTGIDVSDSYWFKGYYRQTFSDHICFSVILFLLNNSNETITNDDKILNLKYYSFISFPIF